MAAAITVSPICLTEILPEIVNIENELVSQRKNIKLYNNTFESFLGKPCNEKFKNFVENHITVKCADGKIRFQPSYISRNEYHSCREYDLRCPSSPLEYLANKITSHCRYSDSKDHILFLLEKYPMLMNIKDPLGIYPLHYFLRKIFNVFHEIKYTEKYTKKVKSALLSSELEKISKIFKILIHSEAPLHHDHIEDYTYRDRMQDFSGYIFYSPLEVIIVQNLHKGKLRKDSAILRSSFCSIIRELIENEKQNAVQLDNFLPQMPTELISIIDQYNNPFYYREILGQPKNCRLLTTAISSGNIEAVKLLLELGAEPETAVDDYALQQCLSLSDIHLDGTFSSCLELACKLTSDETLSKDEVSSEKYKNIKVLLETHISQRIALNTTHSDILSTSERRVRNKVYVSRPTLERTAESQKSKKDCVIQ